MTVREEADASHSRATEISAAVEDLESSLAAAERKLAAAEAQAAADKTAVDEVNFFFSFSLISADFFSENNTVLNRYVPFYDPN